MSGYVNPATKAFIRELSERHFVVMAELADKARKIRNFEKAFRKVKEIDYDDFWSIVFHLTERTLLYAGSEFCHVGYMRRELRRLKKLLLGAYQNEPLVKVLYESAEKNSFCHYPKDGGLMLDVKYLSVINSVLKTRSFEKDGSRRVPKNILRLAEWWCDADERHLKQCFLMREFLPLTLTKLEDAENKIQTIKSKYVKR